jgi:hypothetical protein
MKTGGKNQSGVNGRGSLLRINLVFFTLHIYDFILDYDLIARVIKTQYGHAGFRFRHPEICN